jgi:T5orf172 domain
MPGLVKIGFTTRCVQERIRQLSNTSVPTPFECAFAFRCNMGESIESIVHSSLAEFRVAGEFFKIDVQFVIPILKAVMTLVQGVPVTNLAST